MLHVGTGVHTYRCTHQRELVSPWTHVTMSFGWRPSRSTYSSLSQDGRQTHDWSVCLTWNSIMLFSSARSPVFGSKQCVFWTWVQIILHISKFRYSLISFWPLTMDLCLLVFRLSAEETSSLWKFLHTSHSECGRENKTNPTTYSGAWSQVLLLIISQGGQISLSPLGPRCPSLWGLCMSWLARPSPASRLLSLSSQESSWFELL